MKTKIKILLLAGVMIASSGLSCRCQTAEQAQLLEPVEITWWGVYDDPENLGDLINDYHALHPNIAVNYRKLRAEEFEKELLNALAEDRGPDIFSIHHTWLTKYLNKIEPLPPTTKMAYQTVQKSLGIKQETIIEVKESVSLTEKQLQSAYLDVVYNDVVRSGKIYGLPLTVDTLVLFYNRDLFNNAGIPLPPKTWVELQENVKRLTYQDKSGNLVQSGAALGTAENIERSPDILTLLMMQNGAEMASGRSVTFQVVPPNFNDRSYNPGPEALRFYTDFNNPTKEVYTWNDTFPNSIDAFAQGKVAMVFGYNYHLPYLETKRQGKLNFGLAAMPQIEGRPQINLANYWVQSVSKKSKHINEAWDFLQFISKSGEAKKYLDRTGKPTALRSLIIDQQANDTIKIFADQLLTAKSWYQGRDAVVMENALKAMITAVNQSTPLSDAVGLAAQKIQQTY